MKSDESVNWIRIQDGEEVNIMSEQLKKIECPSPCNFSVRSHDEKEIVELTLQHAKKIHNQTMAEQDVRKMIRPA